MNPESLLLEGLVIALAQLMPGTDRQQLEIWAHKVIQILKSVPDPLQREIELTAAFAAAVKAAKGAL